MIIKLLIRSGWLVLPLFVVIVVGSTLGLVGNRNWISADPELRQVLDESKKSITEPKVFDWQRRGIVTLWFDDGWLSEYKEGIRYLQTEGFVGVLAITTDYVGYEAYMNWPQIKKAAFWGWEISAHSRTHNCEPDKMDGAELWREVVGSKEILNKYGFEIQDYVAPCGKYNQAMIELTKEHYRTLRITDSGLNAVPVGEARILKSNTVTSNTSIEEIRTWINDANNKRQWLILVFHQIDEGSSEYSVSQSKLIKIVEEINRSGIQVATPNQVFSLNK